MVFVMIDVTFGHGLAALNGLSLGTAGDDDECDRHFLLGLVRSVARVATL